MLPSNVSDENAFGERGTISPLYRSSPGATMDHSRDASVQSWQCFPEGSLSSIDSLPPIEDDESLHNNDSPARVHSREDSNSRVKLMCSYGGRIIPRPLDGKLRYVGGETRIVSVNRNVTYAELMHKMMEHYGHDLFLKYQLPNEELDALISVSTEEDLQNMMEEYDRLEGGGDGLQRLRVFLFSNQDGDFFMDQLDPKRSEQWYVEAVNGFLETGSRRSDSAYSGYSGGGLSARPSNENLVALDVPDAEDPTALLHVKRIQELHHSSPHAKHFGNYMLDGQAPPPQHLGGVDSDFYYSVPVHEHERIPPKMPRVSSHGKLSRLQDDNAQELHGHERYSTPHRLHHPEVNSQEYRKEYNGIGDGGYSHLHQHLLPQQMVYHKDQLYNNREYQVHDFIPPPQQQQHHLQHQEDYCPHLYQRSSHLEAGYIGASNPSSPLRHAAHPFHLHRQPAYNANTVEPQYLRRPLMRQESPIYRVSTSPPRYREHHEDHRLDDRNMFHHGAEHVLLDQKPVAVYAPGYQESSFYGGGDVRRAMPPLASHVTRLDYQDPLAQMEHLSLHSQRQHHQTRIPEGAEGPKYRDQSEIIDKNVEVEQRQYRAGHQPFESGMNHYVKQLASLPVMLHDNTDASSKGKDSDNIDWFIGEDGDGLSCAEQQLFDTGSVSTRMEAKFSVVTSSCLAGLDQGQRAAAPAVLVDVPLFDKSGVYEMPPSAWSGGSHGELSASIKSAVVNVTPVLDLLSDVPTAAQSRMMSETGHLAEDVASSVLKSSLRRQEQEITLKQFETPGSDHLGNIESLQQGTLQSQPPPELVSEPTFTVQNWENALIHDNGTPREEAACNEDESAEADVNGQEKTPEGSVDKDKPPADIAFLAEQEAIARGLQTIRNSDLEEIRELGSGTYGTVYHGKWRGTDVAIKRIKASCFEGKPSERERLVADFWKEACTLSQLHHPNVVAFYGVVPDGPGGTLATVTEYMVNGSLKQVLQKKDRTIDRRKRLLIALDAAFGMEYLHGKNIVHFDLKCENLLVNMRDPHRPVCKVGDLGLSKVKRQTMVSGGVRGTLPWMAPELLSTTGSMVTEKVDVYSFGIVMWELLTGEEPYADKHYGAIIGGIVSNTLRPIIPQWCEPAWRSLMERCWSADASTRPSFSEVASELRAMSSSLQPKA